MNYEKRMLGFLQQNPHMKITPDMLASLWKRSKADVKFAAVKLIHSGKIKMGVDQVMKLKTCDGIGGA